MSFIIHSDTVRSISQINKKAQVLKNGIVGGQAHDYLLIYVFGFVIIISNKHHSIQISDKQSYFFVKKYIGRSDTRWQLMYIINMDSFKLRDFFSRHHPNVQRRNYHGFYTLYLSHYVNNEKTIIL